MRTRNHLLFLGLASALTCAFPRAAEAAGTHFVLELSTGLAESAYVTGGPGLAYGASFGFTWKWRHLPARFALLGTAMGRNAFAEGRHEGLLVAVDRRDVDVYASFRTAIPIWRFVRAYGDVGLGERFRVQTVHRMGLEPLETTSGELLLILALGVQARLSENFSIGVRGEVAPLQPSPDLASHAGDFAATRARTALLAQIGIHF